MRRLQVLNILLLAILLSGLVLAQEKTAVAVLDLKGIGLPQDEVQIISSRVRTELVQTNRFTVVEREKMKDILDEQGLQLSGCTSDECVVQAGRLLGVKQMVAGEIGKIGQLYTLTLRLIDVQSGKISKTASEDCSCPVEDVLTTAVKNAAAKLAGLAVNAEKPKDLINIKSSQGRKIRREEAVHHPYHKNDLKKQDKKIDLSDFEVVNIGRVVKILPGRMLVRFNKRENLAKGPCVIVRFNKKVKHLLPRCRSQISGFKGELAVVKIPASCKPHKTDRVVIVKRRKQSQVKGGLR